MITFSRAFLIAVIATAFISISPNTAQSHGGGLDSRGGHNDSKNGGYHCHRCKDEEGGTAAPSDSSCSRYDRSDYGAWGDSDKDCQNTRHEILIAASLISPTFKSARKCRVVSGKWYDPYTNTYIYNAGELHIDHIVPLAEAHRSGSCTWSDKIKHQFYNYTANLIPVSASANLSKGDKDPANWMPRNSAYACTYLQRWVEVKTTWALDIDPRERRAIDSWECP